MKSKKFKFKGKQVLLVGLVALVLAAGYYRWSVESQNIVSIPVTSDAVPTNTAEASASPAPSGENKDQKAEGEKQDASNGEKKSLSQAKQERDTNRSESIEMWKQIAENGEATPEAKSEAETKIQKSTENAEKEKTIETMVKAKGFEDCLVLFDDKGVSVVVSGKELDSSNVAQIKDIIISQTEIPAREIKISQQ